MIPPAATADPRAFEILRVWAAEQQQHVVIHSGLNGGASGFGFMLAQLLEHGARLYAQRRHTGVNHTRAEILRSFRRELKVQAGKATGSIR
jgi:hypothetical protein